MHPARFSLGVGFVLGVASNAAPLRQQRLSVVCHCSNRHALHPEICGPAQQVLAGFGTVHVRPGVVAAGAVSAGNVQRFAKVLPDALQYHHQLLVDHDGVAAIVTGKLPHSEAGAQLFLAVSGTAVLFDCHFDVPFICKFSMLLLTLYFSCDILYSERA